MSSICSYSASSRSGGRSRLPRRARAGCAPFLLTVFMVPASREGRGGASGVDRRRDWSSLLSLYGSSQELVQEGRDASASRGGLFHRRGLAQGLFLRLGGHLPARQDRVGVRRDGGGRRAVQLPGQHLMSFGR